MLDWIKDTWYKVKLFIRNVWKYRTILLDDYDWDYEFLLTMIRFKLVNMINYFEKSGHLESNQQSAAQMKDCLTNLDIYLNKTYQNKVEVEHRMLYGDYKPKFDLVTGNSYNLHREYTKHYSPEEQSKIEADYWSEMLYAVQQEEIALETAFEIIGKNITTWWD